jgi:hypothetical protein
VRKENKDTRLSKFLNPILEPSIRLPRSLMNKKSQLFLESFPAYIKIGGAALENKIIPGRPNSPCSQHNQFHEERHFQFIFETGNDTLNVILLRRCPRRVEILPT